MSLTATATPTGPSTGTGHVAVELARLRHELALGADDPTLDFLAELGPTEVARLRRRVVDARHRRHEHRFARLAGLTRFVPVAVCARVAEAALGPLVAARTAEVMPQPDAVRLAARISPDFLAELTTYLDPARSGPLVADLPEPLLVAVGRRMLASAEHLALGGFVGVMAPRASVEVIRDAPGLAVLEVALHAEDAGALDAVVAGLPDATLLRVLAAATDAGRAADAVLLLGVLGLDTRTRLFELLTRLERETQRQVVAAVVARGDWEHVLPVLSRVGPETLRQLLTLPEIADPDVVAGLVRQTAAHAGPHPVP
ncbi:hypothetical protein INN71_10270 [Nocardioides sp. ChNu-153]|uniref:hypothetical protein n=1 Tax=Nocardioides sp. ChNu-153 TaxID=2779364 RepID=UPI00264B00B6|nr:hypothetical protein [Nocardioides sp. ChNu-153]MDN7121772.1 hypothetical protein [Nocardioides sp. ChNu-153]